jgi:hypothetical protein
LVPVTLTIDLTNSATVVHWPDRHAGAERDGRGRRDGVTGWVVDDVGIASVKVCADVWRPSLQVIVRRGWCRAVVFVGDAVQVSARGRTWKRRSKPAGLEPGGLRDAGVDQHAAAQHGHLRPTAVRAR